MRKLLKPFLLAVLAGISISLGGLVFLSLEDRVIGSALFTVGLFTVCSFQLNLFTGKVCFVFQNDRKYAALLPWIWVGNLVGTGLTALCAGMTRNGAALSERAAAICAVKLEDRFLSLLLLGVLCNNFIYIAVEGYRSSTHEIGKYLAIFLGVMVFILSGTEHCVADMFYFWMGGSWSMRGVICILIITLGNSVGGVLFPLLRSIRE